MSSRTSAASSSAPSLRRRLPERRLGRRGRGARGRRAAASPAAGRRPVGATRGLRPAAHAAGRGLAAAPPNPVQGELLRHANASIGTPARRSKGFPRSLRASKPGRRRHLDASASTSETFPVRHVLGKLPRLRAPAPRRSTILGSVEADAASPLVPRPRPRSWAQIAPPRRARGLRALARRPPPLRPPVPRAAAAPHRGARTSRSAAIACSTSAASTSRATPARRSRAPRSGAPALRGLARGGARRAGSRRCSSWRSRRCRSAASSTSTASTRRTSTSTRRSSGPRSRPASSASSGPTARTSSARCRLPLACSRSRSCGWAGASCGPAAPASAPRARLAAPAVVVAAFLIPCSYRTVQASTPDVIYFHAIGGLLKELAGVRTTAQVRPGLRTPPSLPPVTPTAGPAAQRPLHPDRERARRRARARRACPSASLPARRPSCPGTPRIDAAVPDRLPLTQMRSNASTTAIELAVLWSGLQPIATREALHTAPLVFDYAHAAGFDSAYWTSHHMMFANSRLYVQDLPVSHQCGATELDPLADIDLGGRRPAAVGARPVRGARAARAVPRGRSLRQHPRPLPRRPGGRAVPARRSRARRPTTTRRTATSTGTRSTVQDAAIAELIRFVRSSPVGERTVIVFTSDHGEAFREHGQLGHTGSVLDEEIRVPGWIDAPPGTLTAAEEGALRAARDEPVFHTDVTPTDARPDGPLGRARARARTGRRWSGTACSGRRRGRRRWRSRTAPGSGAAPSRTGG